MIKNYLSLVKFSHTIFAMPFALIGFFIALQSVEFDFNLKLIILVILCMVLARNAAMGFNRYLDRHIDNKNPRTAVREIPKGIISEKSALIFVIVNSILLIATTYFINKLVFLLSPIALFIVLGYSYTKKITALCHFVLGLGLSLAPIGAYLSVSGTFNLQPIIFSFVVLFWVSGFDIIYALQDINFDKKENLKSIPVLMGKNNALRLSEILHLLVILLIIWAGYSGSYNLFYWIGALFFFVLLIYQHLIVRPNNLSRVNLAFFTTNGIASLGFAFFTILSFYV